jgi:hypothetical protein
VLWIFCHIQVHPRHLGRQFSCARSKAEGQYLCNLISRAWESKLVSGSKGSTYLLRGHMLVFRVIGCIEFHRHCLPYIGGSIVSLRPSYLRLDRLWPPANAAMRQKARIVVAIGESVAFPKLNFRSLKLGFLACAEQLPAAASRRLQRTAWTSCRLRIVPSYPGGISKCKFTK